MDFLIGSRKMKTSLVFFTPHEQLYCWNNTLTLSKSTNVYWKKVWNVNRPYSHCCYCFVHIPRDFKHKNARNLFAKISHPITCPVVCFFTEHNIQMSLCQKIYIYYIFIYVYLHIYIIICVYVHICIHTQTHHVNGHAEF